MTNYKAKKPLLLLTLTFRYAFPLLSRRLKVMKILKILGFLLVAIVLLGLILLYEGDIPKDVIDARYASPASQFLEMGEKGRIHYRDEGNRRDAAIVLLHGSSASLHTWEPWVERLSASYRVVSLDFPGHGLTGETPSGDYSGEAFIKVVESVVRNLELEEFVLAGNSMGGSIAWRYAARHPEQLKGLVLISSGGHPDWRIEQVQNDNERDGVLAFELLRKPWFRSIASNIDPYYLTVQGIKSAYNNSPVINDELIMRYYDLNMREGTRRATMARFGYSWDDNAPDLASIQTPTLIMWGEMDALTPFENANRFAEILPNTSTAYYAGVGHIPMEEIAQQSANDLIEFLESLDVESETKAEN